MGIEVDVSAIVPTQAALAAALGTFYRADADPVWVGAPAFSVQSGGSTLVDGVGLVPYWQLLDAATNVLTAAALLPSSWQTFTADWWYLQTAVTAGDVDLSERIGTQAVADGVTLAGTTNVVFGATLTAVAPAAQKVQVHPNAAAQANTAGAPLFFYTRRNGAAGGDTLAATWGFLGIMCKKVT